MANREPKPDHYDDHTKNDKKATETMSTTESEWTRERKRKDAIKELRRFGHDDAADELERRGQGLDPDALAVSLEALISPEAKRKRSETEFAEQVQREYRQMQSPEGISDSRARLQDSIFGKGNGSFNDNKKVMSPSVV